MRAVVAEHQVGSSAVEQQVCGLEGQREALDTHITVGCHHAVHCSQISFILSLQEHLWTVALQCFSDIKKESKDQNDNTDSTL